MLSNFESKLRALLRFGHFLSGRRDCGENGTPLELYGAVKVDQSPTGLLLPRNGF